MANEPRSEQIVGGSQVEGGEGTVERQMGASSQTETGRTPETVAATVETKPSLVATMVNEAVVTDFTEKYDRIVDGDLVEGTRLNAEGRKKTREMFDVLIESNQGDLPAMRQQLINEYAAIKTQVTDPAKLLGYRRMFQSLHGLLQAEAIETYARVSTPETMVNTVDPGAKSTETFSVKLVRGAQQRRALMAGREGGYAEYLQIIEAARKEFDRRLAVLDGQANAAIEAHVYEATAGMTPRFADEAVIAEVIPAPADLVLGSEITYPAPVDLVPPPVSHEVMVPSPTLFQRFRADLRQTISNWPRLRRLALTGAVLGVSAVAVGAGAGAGSEVTPAKVAAAVNKETRGTTITYTPPSTGEKLVYPDRLEGLEEERFVGRTPASVDTEKASSPDFVGLVRDPKAHEIAASVVDAPVLLENQGPQDMVEVTQHTEVAVFTPELRAQFEANGATIEENEKGEIVISMAPTVRPGWYGGSIGGRRWGSEIYKGKDENAAVTNDQLQEYFKDRELKPGDVINLIGDNVINFGDSRYIVALNTSGSGGCWPVSTLGQALDEANAHSAVKMFNILKSSKHGHIYLTYTAPEGRTGEHPELLTGGYTVYQNGDGSAKHEFAFQVDPALAEQFPGYDVSIKLMPTFTFGGRNAEDPATAATQVQLLLKPKAGFKQIEVQAGGKKTLGQPARRFNNTGPISRAQAKQVPPMKVSFIGRK